MRGVCRPACIDHQPWPCQDRASRPARVNPSLPAGSRPAIRGNGRETPRRVRAAFSFRVGGECRRETAHRTSGALVRQAERTRAPATVRLTRRRFAVLRPRLCYQGSVRGCSARNPPCRPGMFSEHPRTAGCCPTSRPSSHS